MAEQKGTLAELRRDLDAADERAKSLDLFPSVEMETSYVRKLLAVVEAAKELERVVRIGSHVGCRPADAALRSLQAALAALDGEKGGGDR